MANNELSLSDIFDENRFSPIQLTVCALCFLVTFIDGFDITVVGVALPNIADHLSTSPKALGFALSAGQFGPLIGAVTLGMLADRYGRKWMLFISVVVFGVFTFLTVFIHSVEQLALFRFLAGIGLGGAVPNALTLGAEYSPVRIKASIVATMYAGMPAGAMIGGILAAYLIPHFGWQSLFVFGGIAPLIIAFFLAIALPESLEFLIKRNKDGDVATLRKIVGKISPQTVNDPQLHIVSADKKLPGAAVKHLFSEKQIVTTLLLWTLCVSSLYLLWMINTWAPTMLRNSGATVQQYSLAYGFISFGAVIAAITVGRLMDKFPPVRVLQTGFVATGISVALFGFGATSGSFLLIAFLSAICGFCTAGIQTGTMAVSTISYPSDIRATGLGWVYAVGKIGAMLAPIIGGFQLSHGWNVQWICGASAMVGLATAVILVMMQRFLGNPVHHKKNAMGQSCEVSMYSSSNAKKLN